MFSGHGLERLGGCVGPGEQIVDGAVEVAVDDPGDDVGEINVRVDAAEFAVLDQRGDDGPVVAAAIRRDVMMPGIWAVKLSSPIRSIRYSESQLLSLPIGCMAAPVI
jgi:hypothetical protein